MKLIQQKGYTLIELILVIGLSAMVVTVITFGMFNFRNTVQYDILLNKMVESVHYAKLKASNSKLDDENQRISYGVKFTESSVIEFEGDTYDELDTRNVVYNVPLGFRLGVECQPENNGIVVFSPIEAESTNICNVSIYRWEQTTPSGDIEIGTHGVEKAI